jgi:hypothetical protein
MNNDTTPIRSGGSRRDQASDERLEILHLVQEGAVTAEEAARLLDALGEGDRVPHRASTVDSSSNRGRHVRIRVTDQQSGKPHVNLVLPFGLVDIGLSFAQSFAPTMLGDTAALRETLFSGLRGPLIEVDNDGERVEISVE